MSRETDLARTERRRAGEEAADRLNTQIRRLKLSGATDEQIMARLPGVSRTRVLKIGVGRQ